jgi:hypothetical protein
MQTAAMIVFCIQIWALIGACVAAVFLTIGIDRVDEDARGAYAFRPLLIPAILLLWPLVIWRWWQIETDTTGWASRYRPIRKGHQLAAILLALGIVAALWLGLTMRQTWPADIAPVQLSAGDKP